MDGHYCKNFIKFRQNWPNGSGEDEFIWIKLNLFTKRCFVPSSVKIGPVGLEKNFLISSMFFRYFVFISSWKRNRVLHFNKLESPSPKDALCQVWLKLAQWFWRRWRNVESLQTDGRTTDNRQSEKFTWAFSSGKLKTTTKASCVIKSL